MTNLERGVCFIYSIFTHTAICCISIIYSNKARSCPVTGQNDQNDLAAVARNTTWYSGQTLVFWPLFRALPSSAYNLAQDVRRASIWQSAVQKSAFCFKYSYRDIKSFLENNDSKSRSKKRKKSRGRSSGADSIRKKRRYLYFVTAVCIKCCALGPQSHHTENIYVKMLSLLNKMHKKVQYKIRQFYSYAMPLWFLQKMSLIIAGFFDDLKLKILP